MRETHTYQLPNVQRTRDTKEGKAILFLPFLVSIYSGSGI